MKNSPTDGHPTEGQMRVEAGIFEAVAKNELAGVARGLLAITGDIEDRVRAGEDSTFEAIQRLAIVERRLDELPTTQDLKTIHTLIFGDARLGVLGLQVLMTQMQSAVSRLDRAVSAMMSITVGLMVVGLLVAVTTWMLSGG